MREILQKMTAAAMKNEAFAWDFPQELELEDVKTKLSCETPLKNWKLTM
jgi:hypothetical protein